MGNSIGIFPHYIFGKYSIGIQRFFFIFLILLNKIFIILICKKIVESINSTNKKEVIFLILSLSSITLASFYENVTPFHPRIFIFLAFCLLVFKVILTIKKWGGKLIEPKYTKNISSTKIKSNLISQLTPTSRVSNLRRLLKKVVNYTSQC